MEAKAIKKYERISPRKVRLVLNEIRYKNAKKSVESLSFNSKRAAKLILKVLKSAIENAKNKDAGIDAEDLFITKAYADQGFTLKRFMPRSRGMANSIRKPTSHITIVVSDELSGRRN